MESKVPKTEQEIMDVTAATLLNSEDIKVKSGIPLLYSVEDNPSWPLSVALGIQQYFTLFGGSIVMPFVLAHIMCFESQSIVISEVMGTLFFVYGISTILQTLLGIRLPIVQGGSFSFVGPAAAILNLPGYKCSSPHSVNAQNSTEHWNRTIPANGNYVIQELAQDDWTIRMNVICGSLMVASLFQVIVGFSGLIGYLLKFIGPLTTSTVVSLIGLHLYGIAASKSGTSWLVSGITIFLVLLFTLYLAEVPILFPWRGRKKRFKFVRIKVFKLFPLLLAVLISWAFCSILTASGVFTDDPTKPEYKARTDVNIQVIREAKWIRIPYPGQWGRPTVTAAGVTGMLVAVLTSILESVGDYYACARMSSTPPPPKHAVNRGIGIEGIGCILSGAFGAGIGVTSFSENIAAIGITKVASRRVIMVAGITMTLCGIIGKFGALFTTLPTPVIGGVFFVLFGLITSVGIANLQLVNMSLSRNLTIYGFAVLAGLGIPHWFKANSHLINTGIKDLDQIIIVLLTTEITVGGFIACLLDNTAPGDLKDRGISGSTSQPTENDSDDNEIFVYNLPLPLHRLLNAIPVSRFLPFLPPKYNQNEWRV